MQTIRALGLDPDRFQLTAFLAAAGVSAEIIDFVLRINGKQYVLAAVSNGLPDPPFVHNGWATADFKVRRRSVPYIKQLY